MLEMDKIIFHSIAFVPDKKSIYVFSKQISSINCGEKTRNKTAAEEKPKLAGYLAMVQIAIEPTTISSPGHT